MILLMTTDPARTPQGQQTRARILSAATALFSERGFAAVTIRSIGEAAGIDNSSIYRHFESKSALAQAVLIQALTELTEATSHADKVPPTLEGLGAVIRSVGLALWDRPATARLILHLLLGWRDAPANFLVGIRLDTSDDPAAALFRLVASAYASAAQAGRVRAGALPDIFVPLIGALVLRPATRGELLSSQEAKRNPSEQRRAWSMEIDHFARTSLAP